MNHPYSGSASYIYANGYAPRPSWYGPYSHMRSFAPDMSSMEAFPAQWVPPSSNGHVSTEQWPWLGEKDMLSFSDPKPMYVLALKRWRQRIRTRVLCAVRKMRYWYIGH
ncbi:uncharacterized protein BT62DRAFT_933207, partial [Guyanagaster necrorhizus]